MWNQAIGSLTCRLQLGNFTFVVSCHDFVLQGWTVLLWSNISANFVAIFVSFVSLLVFSVIDPF